MESHAGAGKKEHMISHECDRLGMRLGITHRVECIQYQLLYAPFDIKAGARLRIGRDFHAYAVTAPPWDGEARTDIEALHYFWMRKAPSIERAGVPQ